jgi:hypothetical protein
MIETALLTISIAFAIHTIRRGRRQARQVWRAARWYERLGLVLLFVPIPGPLDEIIALLVIRRVLARMARA